MSPHQIIGVSVDASPAPRPERRVFEGRLVRLEPLTRDHARDFYAATHGADAERLWRYLFVGPFADYADFEAYVDACAASNDQLAYAIIDKASGKAVGSASLMNIHAANRSIEVGAMTYGAPLQRTAGGTEVVYLLARHIFDDLGYRRFEWKCNDLNAPSRRAALRFGQYVTGLN